MTLYESFTHLPIHNCIRGCINSRWPSVLRQQRVLLSSTSATNSSVPQPPKKERTGTPKAEMISQAMKSYLTKSRAHEEFLKKEIAEFEIGKRHLANIMSLDPDNITKRDIKDAINYLLPSGVHDEKARPFMKHPVDFMPKRKAVQFADDGRPFHTLFYTRFPEIFQLMFDIVQKQEKLKVYEDSMLSQGIHDGHEQQISLVGSNWIKKTNLESRINEDIHDSEYEQFLKIMERLAEQPYSNKEEDFIRKYRVDLISKGSRKVVQKVEVDEHGREYFQTVGHRKLAEAHVKLWIKGTGQLTINNKQLIDYFENMSEREQIMYPLQFLDCIGDVDIDVTVSSGGCQGQAGAIRLGISKAMSMFVDERSVEKMRLAGLLTRDPRRLERQKPGQSGARRKFTWKKR